MDPVGATLKSLSSPCTRTLDPTGTATGLFCWAVFPMPSCPKSFLPQHLELLPTMIAHEWEPPKSMAMAVTPVGVWMRSRGRLKQQAFKPATLLSKDRGHWQLFLKLRETPWRNVYTRPWKLKCYAFNNCVADLNQGDQEIRW
jgi:hypothetical protein